MFNVMKKDDRTTYVDKCVAVVLQQGADKHVECVAAYMDDEKAARHVARIKNEGGYAWYRDVDIVG